MRTSAPAVPIILCGTKVDRRSDSNASSCVSTSEGLGLQKLHNFGAFVECSAKTLNNYKTSFDKAIVAVLKFREKPKKKETGRRWCSIF